MLLIHSRSGLICPLGDFSIDPMNSVETAVVTHAHSDHARRGSQRYFTAQSGVSLLQQRIGKKAPIFGIPYGQRFQLGQVQVSFHPAGHILGSAQVRIEHNGQVWVASGDYKREPDPTCEPFEVVPCDTFITEATFGTPVYRWNKSANLGLDLHQWITQNESLGYNSVIFGYSLGKTQRLLGLLKPWVKKPIFCHPAARELNRCYREMGVPLADTLCLSSLEPRDQLHTEIVIAPQSFLKTAEASCLGKRYKTAFASGWMNRGHHGYDHGFPISDHADWDDLVRTALETGARRVYVQHRGNGALVRHLKTLGIEAFPDSDLSPLKNLDPPAQQLSLF